MLEDKTKYHMTHSKDVFKIKVKELEVIIKNLLNSENSLKSQEDKLSAEYFNIDEPTRIPSQVDLDDIDKMLNNIIFVNSQNPSFCKNKYKFSEEFTNEHI